MTVGLDLPVLSVHREGSQRRMALYRALLDRLDVWLADREALGVVVMDGEDQSYRSVHRDLPLATRRIIEDTRLQGSHDSQFVQVADLVAHAAFQSVERAAQRSFMWEWYPNRFGLFR